MKLTSFSSIALTAALAAACTSSKTASVAPDLNGQWTITTIEGAKVDSLPEAPFVLTFENEAFSCTTDCNGLMGFYTLNGSMLNFTDIASTRMACPDSHIEESVIKLLPQIATVGQLSDGGIGLYDGKDNMLFRLERHMDQ